MRPHPRLVLPYILPFSLSAVCTLASYLAAGPTAGMFFGGFVFVTLLTPPFVLRRDRLRDQVLSTAAVIGAVAAMWLAAVLLEASLTTADVLNCSLILICYASALAGCSTLLSALRLPPAVAAAVTTLLGLLWLTWPIWLSPALGGQDRWVSWLTPAHPLLAADHALTALGSPWTEHRLMYNQLSILNQDVVYALPSTILWTCLWHATVAAVGVGLARALLATPRRPSESLSAAAPQQSLAPPIPRDTRRA